jgi:high affinity sulfate transporter 1
MSLKLLGGLLPVSRRGLARDVLAGVNLAAVDIPQVLGYARIAGMPIVTGLYTILLPLLAFALFGSSRHLVVAADSATAAIFYGSLSRMAEPGSEHYLVLAGAVAALTAGLLLLARLFKLGFLADFLSRTVLTGFLTGVGLQVAIAMSSDMLGVAGKSRYALAQAFNVLRALPESNLPTVALSAAVFVVVLLGRKLAPRLPIALLAVVGSIAASVSLHLDSLGIAVVGSVPAGVPTLQVPLVTWSELLALLPVAGSCFVMILTQSAATSRAFAARYRESFDGNDDLLGLSAANVAAAVSGAFVVNGSPTQTAMADQVGARSQLAQLALGGIVLLVLLFLTPTLQRLPQCVLAAIVATIAVGMIDVAGLRRIRRESPGEFYLAIATAAAVVAAGVEQGILLAMALSLFRHVRHSYRPHTMLLAPGANGRWTPIPATPGTVTAPGLIIYRFGADLFYANADRFVDEVRALIEQAPTPVRRFVIDAGAITDIDYSAAQAVRDLLRELAGRGVGVVFGRVTSYLRADMDRHGITGVVGASQVFTTLHEALASLGDVAPAAAGAV